MNTQIRKSEKTRRQILDATAVCFSRIGVEKTSITQIALEAQISRALVAHYFPKKDEMFLQVVRHLSRKFGEFFKSREGGAEPKFIAHLRANLDFFIDSPEHFKTFYLFYYYASLKRSFRDLNTRMTDQTIARFAADIREYFVSGGQPVTEETSKELAAAVQRELTGSIQYFFIVEHGKTADEFKKRIIDACLGILEGERLVTSC